MPGSAPFLISDPCSSVVGNDSLLLLNGCFRVHCLPYPVSVSIVLVFEHNRWTVLLSLSDFVSLLVVRPNRMRNLNTPHVDHPFTQPIRHIVSAHYTALEASA